MRKKVTSRTNLIIAAVVHIVIVGALGFFASREGMLGTKMKQLSVVLVPKPKIEETPKPKVVEPKINLPPPVQQNIPKVQPPVESTPAPKMATAPSVAPAPAELPALSFSDGAKNVVASSDPNQIYKTTIERYLQSKWNTPDNDGLVMVDIQIDQQGNILNTSFLDAHGNNWQGSVGSLFRSVTRLPSPPPKSFPLRFKIRFDLANQ